MNDDAIMDDLEGFGPLPKARIDAVARYLCRRWAEGSMDEASVRMQLAGLLYRTGEIESVAGERMAGFRGQQFRLDVAENLRDLVVSKTRDSLDLSMVASGYSFMGWAHQLARAACGTAIRTVSRSNNRVAVPAVPLDEMDERSLRPVEAADGDDQWAAFESAASAYAVRANRQHELRRLQLQSRTLQQALSLPAPQRLPSEASNQVLAELDDDPHAAARVVSALANGHDPDSAVAAVFASWHPADLESLSEHDEIVATTLARSAASPAPPLPSALTRALVKRFAEHLSMSPRAAHLPYRVVHAWVQANATLRWIKPGVWQAKPDAEVAADAAAFAFEATLLCRQGTVFAHPEEVSAWLLDASDDVAVEQSKAAAVA